MGLDRPQTLGRARQPADPGSQTPASAYFCANPGFGGQGLRAGGASRGAGLQRSGLDGGEDGQLEAGGGAGEGHVGDVPLGKPHPGGACHGAFGVGDDGEVPQLDAGGGAGARGAGFQGTGVGEDEQRLLVCLLYTSPSPRD